MMRIIYATLAGALLVSACAPAPQVEIPRNIQQRPDFVPLAAFAPTAPPPPDPAVEMLERAQKLREKVPTLREPVLPEGLRQRIERRRALQ